MFPVLLVTERRFSAEVDNVLRGQRLRNESMPGVGMVSEQELTKRFQKLCLLSVRLVTQRGTNRGMLPSVKLLLISVDI